jgi:hypothetical protein
VLPPAPLQGGTPTPQRRYISKHSPVHTKHALAGRAGLRDGRHQRQARLGGWAGRGIPPTSPRTTTRLPGGRPGNPAGGEQGCCPRGAPWSGDARTTGCHTGSQRGRTVSASATLPGHRRTLKSPVNTPIAAARTHREPVDGSASGRQSVVPSPGGQISGIPASKNCCGWVGWARCGIPSTSRGLPRGIPGAEPDDARAGSVEGCPRDAAWSGCARSTGCHTNRSVQDRLLGPSPGRRMSRSIEKPGEVARAFSWSTPLHPPVGAGGEVWGGRAGL